MLALSVCIGTSCHLKGSYNVIQSFQQKIEEHALHDRLDFKAVFCLKQCHSDGVSVTVGEEVFKVKPQDADAFFEKEVMTRLK